MKITIDVTYKNKTRSKSFDKEEIIIGRKKDTPIDLDLAPDLRVSRPHARLFYDQSTWWIVEDEASVWGTVYHDEKVTAGNPVPLYSDDEIILGDTRLKVQFQTATPDTIRPEDGIVESHFEVDEYQPVQDVSESDRLDILVRIQAIVRTKSGQAMLDAIVQDLLAKFPQAERASIVFYKDKQLLPVAFHPASQAPCSFTLARRAMNQRDAFIWDRKLASNKSRMMSVLDEVVTAMYVPIILNRRVHGILHVDSTQVDAQFTDQHLETLSEIANAVGKSITIAAEDAQNTIPSIFISYSHKDMTFVKSLVKSLRRDPINVWFDERLRAGKDWRQQLKQAVGIFDVFVLIYSPDSVASEYVQWEIDWAKTANKPILPVMYRGCTPPDDLKNTQYIDMRTMYEEKITDLIEEIYQNTKKYK